jgi:hypothetical protein
MSPTEQKRYGDSIDMTLLGWKTVLTALFPEERNTWYCTTPDAEATLLSIKILGETLQ